MLIFYELYSISLGISECGNSYWANRFLLHQRIGKMIHDYMWPFTRMCLLYMQFLARYHYLWMMLFLPLTNRIFHVFLNTHMCWHNIRILYWDCELPFYIVLWNVRFLILMLWLYYILWLCVNVVNQGHYIIDCIFTYVIDWWGF